jgi:hypothetical protein
MDIPLAGFQRLHGMSPGALPGKPKASETAMENVPRVQRVGSRGTLTASQAVFVPRARPARSRGTFSAPAPSSTAPAPSSTAPAPRVHRAAPAFDLAPPDAGTLGAISLAIPAAAGTSNLRRIYETGNQARRFRPFRTQESASRFSIWMQSICLSGTREAKAANLRCCPTVCPVLALLAAYRPTYCTEMEDPYQHITLSRDCRARGPKPRLQKAPVFAAARLGFYRVPSTRVRLGSQVQ